MVLKILAMFEPQTLPGISKPLRPLRRTARLCDSIDSILKNLLPFFSEIHSRKTGNSIKQEVFVDRATIKPLAHAVLSVENTSVHVLKVTTAADTLATAIVSISICYYSFQRLISYCFVLKSKRINYFVMMFLKLLQIVPFMTYHFLRFLDIYTLAV